MKELIMQFFCVQSPAGTPPGGIEAVWRSGANHCRDASTQPGAHRGATETLGVERCGGTREAVQGSRMKHQLMAEQWDTFARARVSVEAQKAGKG